MNRHTIMCNLGVAFLAQGFSMLLGVLQTLLVPRLLGIEQYGYWQLYIFYASYVGFFHLGLSSGVYLEMGGIPRESIDKASVKAQLIFGVAFQSVIATLIAVAGVALASDPSRGFVFVQVAILLVLKNASTYMMNVLQCMNETARSSAATMVERAAFLVPLVVLMVSGMHDFRPYVWALTVAALVQAAFCFWELRDFVASPWLGMRRAARQGTHSISVGFALMLSNVAGMLILGSARWAIDARWGIAEFGRLSLVMSVVSFFLAFVNQAGLVLFPSLRQASASEVRGFYLAARDGLSLLFPAVYLLYFSIARLLAWWLPAYADAVGYLALLLPVCVFDAKMTITGSTFFNVLRQERTMLALNIACAVTSVALAWIGAFVIDSIGAVVVGASAVVVIRSALAERCISRELEVGGTPLTAWELGLTCLFVTTASMLPPAVAAALYGCAYGVYLVLNRRVLATIVSRLR